MGATSDKDEYQRSSTGAGNKKSRQEDTQEVTSVFFSNHPPTQPPPNLKSFDDDVFDTQSPDTSLSRINSTLDRLEIILNNTAIENISQSAKDGSRQSRTAEQQRYNKTLGKITQVDYPTGKYPARDSPKGTNVRNESSRWLLQVGNLPHSY